MEEFKRTAQRPCIAYMEKGQGDALIFLHGIGGNRRNWDKEVQYFGEAYHAVAIDFRGYGDSEGLNDDFELTDFATDVTRVMDTIGAQRAHIVGLSMGGLVAQALYSQAPERVASLSLVACRAADEPILPPVRREAFIRERLDPLRAGGSEALAVSLAPKLLSNAPSAEAREQVMASLRKIRPDAYFKVMEARMRVPPLLDPGSISVPALVVGADEDQVAPPEQMRALAAAVPGARLEEISGAGHLINLEKPQEFQAALESFLTSLKVQ